MYEGFFRLSETPFSIAPNPHYLYMSQQHNEALAHLVYGVGRDGGVVLLTGEVGTGKTTVCRCFLEKIPQDTDVAFILNPKLEVTELLANICDELSIPYIGDSLTVKDYVDHINGFLLRQHAANRHTVLIIDEAQNLNSDVLEQIRLLTNLETHEKKLLQIVLLGQPELQEMFQQPELRQLSQRVTARFHLRALREEEVGPYVYHRLSVAGAMDPKAIFGAQVIKRLHQISQGIPRIINLLCDRSMLGAYADETRVVTVNVLNQSAQEVLGQENVPAKGRFPIPLPWLAAIGGAFVAVIIMLGVIQLGAGGKPQLAQGSDQAPAVEQAKAQTTAESEPAMPATQSGTASQTAGVTDSRLPPPSIASAPVTGNAQAKPLVQDQSPAQATRSLALLDAIVQSNNYTEADAFEELYSAWRIEYDAANDGNPCSYANERGLSCLPRQGSLGSIKHYGLPAVLKLRDPTGGSKYLALRRLENATADIYIQGEIQTVAMADLDDYWLGEFTVLWKKPPNYHVPLRPGTISPLSKWVASQLDIWEQNPNPSVVRSTYDDELVSRVKAFQRLVGESADGIVGAGTLIQLSRRTDANIPLLTSSSGGS